MKTTHVGPTRELGRAPRAAAAPRHQRATTQPFDDSPRQAMQRQAWDRLNAPGVTAPLQLKNGKKGDGKKDEGGAGGGIGVLVGGD